MARGGDLGDTITRGTCESCEITKREQLPGGLELITIVDEETSAQYRVATKTVAAEQDSAQRLYFWVIQSDPELEALQDAMLSVSDDAEEVVSVEGYSGLPAGGWIWWDGNTIIIYISHDLAITWVTGFALVAIICTIIMALPMGALPGLVCDALAGLSATMINYYDEYGEPGFYVYGTVSPLNVWIVP